MCNINSLKFSSSKDQGRSISPESKDRISALPLASSTPPFSSVSPVSRTNFTLSPAEKPLCSLSAAHRLRLVRLPDGDWHRAWSRRAPHSKLTAHSLSGISSPRAARSCTAAPAAAAAHSVFCSCVHGPHFVGTHAEQKHTGPMQ